MINIFNQKNNQILLQSRRSLQYNDISNEFKVKVFNSNYQTKVSKKLSLLEINKQKVIKRNNELLKLFKPTPPLNFNLQLLQKSEMMQKNDIFRYLVQCLKKQRQGIISFQTISSEKSKDPKLIQNKIKQFLYNSLQQSLFMSQKQIMQIKLFERLFEWFTQVFKERQMRLHFKKQECFNRDKNLPDQDWLIRNSYKSNMPLQLQHYQRKMLNAVQFLDFDIKRHNLNQLKGNQDTEILKQNKNISNINRLNYNGLQQKKAFCKTGYNSPNYEKSIQTLPLLNRRKLMKNLSDLSKIREQQEVTLLKNEWKKDKAKLTEHLGKNYFKKLYKKDKVLFENRSWVQNRGKSECKMSKSVIEKVCAAKLGVTLSDFRKNKENEANAKLLFKEQPSIFHPILTCYNFNEIKKKKIEKSIALPSFKRKQKLSNSTEESQDISFENSVLSKKQNENQYQIFDLKQNEGVNEAVQNIDGLGLVVNNLEKNVPKSKKK